MSKRHKYTLAPYPHVTWHVDGLLFFLTDEQSLTALNELKNKGFSVENGEVGYGLYSPSKDRQMAEPGEILTIAGYYKGWWYNPGILRYISFKE